MAFSKELEQEIIVNLKLDEFNPKTNGALSELIFAEPIREIRRKLNRSKTLPEVTTKRLGMYAKTYQVDAINYFNAVCTGRLRSSIVDKGNSSEYSAKRVVGTSSNHKGYLFLVRGRGPVRAKHAKYLRFKPKCKGNFIFRKSVAEALPRNYIARADRFLNLRLAEVIEQEVRHVLS